MERRVRVIENCGLMFHFVPEPAALLLKLSKVCAKTTD